MKIKTNIGDVQINVWGQSAGFFLDEATYDLAQFRASIAAALEAGNSEGAVEFGGRDYSWRIDETDWLEHTSDDGETATAACYAHYTQRLRASR